MHIMYAGAEAEFELHLSKRSLALCRDQLGLLLTWDIGGPIANRDEHKLPV